MSSNQESQVFEMKYFNLLLVVSVLFATGTTFAAEDSSKTQPPFFQPQTALYVGSANYNSTLSKDSQTINFGLNESKITVYGFDIELNYNKFLNIGAYFRSESISKEVALNVTNERFSTLLGAFTKFLYAPQLLNRGNFYTQLFTRLELGAGPVVMSAFPSGVGGFLGQGGVHLGIESYISKWVGLSLSYGRVFEFGRDTLLNTHFNVSGNAGIFLVGLKTTFF
jgi:hypothetical protein